MILRIDDTIWITAVPRRFMRRYHICSLYYGSRTHHTLFLDLFQYIDDALPAESPYLYGLHPNAEIGFLTQTSEKLFRTVLEMQPRDGGSGEGSGGSRDDKVLKHNIQYYFSQVEWCILFCEMKFLSLVWCSCFESTALFSF